MCLLTPSQNFLLLLDVESRHLGLLLEEKRENCIEMEKLTCYWDKVNVVTLK